MLYQVGTHLLVVCECYGVDKVPTAGSDMGSLLTDRPAVRSRWSIYKFVVSDSVQVRDFAALAKQLVDDIDGPVKLASVSATPRACYFLVLNEDDRGRRIKATVRPGVDGALAEMGFKLKKATAQGLMPIVITMGKDCKAIAGTMKIEEVEFTPAELLSYEEVLEQLGKITVDEYHALVANAKIAKARKDMTPLQASILVMNSEVGQYVRDRATAMDLIVHRDDVTVAYPRDFGPRVLEIKLRILDPAEFKFNEITLEQWRDSELAYRLSLFLVGSAGAGKSLLLQGLAQLFCVRFRLPLCLLSKAFDPVGVLTKSGDTKNFACLCWHDFRFETKLGERLHSEHIKAILDVNEAASFPARYHMGCLPKGRPRMFAVNAGRVNGTVDPGSFFDREGVPALGHMARGDLEELRKLSDDEVAICRRVAIAVPDRAEFELDLSSVQEAGRDLLEEHRQAERTFLAERT